LRAAGLAAAKPAVFVVEGVTMYLREERVRALCGELNGLAGPGSCLVINFAAWPAGDRATPAEVTSGRPGVRAALRKAVVAVQDEPFVYQPDASEATALLSATGWSVSELLPEPELAMRYLAGTGLPLAVNPAAFVVVATAAERERLTGVAG
jgi:O-methyltransferase involved in polyketide biosynthesis